MSTPDLRVSAKPSPIASMAQPSTKLLAIFMAVAASGSSPPSKMRRAIASNNGLALTTRAAGAGGDKLGPPHHGRGDEELAFVRMCLLDLADHRNAVCAGADMDAAFGQGI